MNDDDYLSDSQQTPGSDSAPGGILAGWVPPAWSSPSSGLSMIMDPETIASIDFSSEQDGNGPPTGSLQNDGAGGFYTGLTPYNPSVSLQYFSQSAPDAFSQAPGATHQSVTDKWSQLPQPSQLESGEHSSGYYTYGTDPTGRSGTAASGQWEPPRTLEVIGAVADRLATGGQYTPFGVGNISLAGEGKFPGHAGHQDGLDIDVRPARIDGAQSPVTYQDKSYDRAATQRLIDAFRSTGQVDKISFNDPMLDGVQPLDGHDNHFHVRLKR